MPRLQGRVSIVTGAASGIGEGTARKFVAEGAKVLLADIQDGPGEQLAEELGPNAHFQHTDVASEDDVRVAVERAVDRWGRLDCMFNNAGFGGAGGPVELTDMGEYDRTMAVLLRGVFVGIKHATAVMKEQGSGSIVNTASIAGMDAGFGSLTYSTAKAAVIHLTRTAAMELGPFGIRVNAVCPGFIVTHIFDPGAVMLGAPAESFGEKLGEAVSDWPPIGRAGRPEDIANAVAWLASDEASYVTGHAMVVDGGLTSGRSLTELWERFARAAGVDPGQFTPPSGRG
ncbi:MAG: SDR family NAD(P)-dependent oxidoreductase [Dehalococcoidia bacterium]